MDLANPATAQKHTHAVIHVFCQCWEQYAFVSHLSAALGREGISVFVLVMDSLQLEGTASSSYDNQATISVIVTPEIVEVIDQGLNSIEVNERLRLRDNGLQVGRPVSYDPYTFIRLCSRPNIWRKAGSSTEAHRSRISSNMILTDSDLVEEIVKDVYEMVYRTERVGLYSKLLEIENLLYKQPVDVRSIGIWGMPGIGKTTLAKAIFNHMSIDYDASCFIENFDEAFHKEGLHRLLEEKIGKMLKEEFDLKSSYIMRPRLHRDKLSDKRILVVLDDVRDPVAAESFIGRLEWFGLKSMIIMTSIDKQVFAFCHINEIYEVQGLNEQEAWQLFSHIAFGKLMLDQNVREQSMEVIHYANRNPLALQIYGQELKGKMSEMEGAFLKLKQDPPLNIQDVVKSVYIGLGDNEKNIFLDIACFFRGENVKYVVQMLEGCRYLPRIGIDVLEDKCVLTISENTVQMSNLIQDLCQKIFIGETESCARMWEPCSIRYLLEDDELKASGKSSGMPNCGLIVEDVESIILDTSKVKFDVKHDAFKNMFNLRFLKIYNSCSNNVHGLNFPKGLSYLPCGLRLLHWENYPLQSLPQDFDLHDLVELCMPYNQLQTLRTRTKNLKMLKKIWLCHSQQLVEFDILLDAIYIELIDLQGCTRLQSFPDTSELQHLRVVNLSGCIEIKSFEGTPPNIEELHLQGTSIREIPTSMVTHNPQKVKMNRQKFLNLLENFQDDEHIDLEGVTELVRVSSYNQGFGKLVHLNMKDCCHLQSLPDMVCLESLQVLLVSGCSKLEEINGFPRNMKKLYLGGTAIREVPPLPQSLEFLNAHDCRYLKSIRLDFEKLPRHYIFSNCFNFPSQVITEFLKKDLTRVSNLAGVKAQELIKASEVTICIPLGARQRSIFLLQAGPNVTIDLAPWTGKPISGFSMTVVVSFQDDCHNTVGLGIRCICTWKAKSGYSKRTQRTFQCWSPTEAPKVDWDHIFIFYDTEMHPSGEKHPNLWDDKVKFEFYTVSCEKKLLGTNCKVTFCGVEIITDPKDDAISTEITIEGEATTSVIIEDYPPTSSEATTSVIVEDHPPTSSTIVLEAKNPTPLPSNEPPKVSSAQSKLRSKVSMILKWVKTAGRDKKKKALTDREQVDLELETTSTTLGWGRRFTLRDIEMATNRFSEENCIAKGANGVAYRGELINRTPVAIQKIIYQLGQEGEEEFIREVNAIGRLRHKNIACLLGYCIEGTDRILVYEYVRNGNLGNWLRRKKQHVHLTWELRMKILIGTSKALAFLHEAKEFYRDINPSNILINDEIEAKVSHLRLAPLMGTFAYAAPGYISSGMFCEKDDVYSFGVVLLETITGRRPIDDSRPAHEEDLVKWSRMMVSKRRSKKVLDPNIEVRPPARALKRALLTGLRCVDPDIDKRPKMSEVVSMLESKKYPIRGETTGCWNSFSTNRV